MNKRLVLAGIALAVVGGLVAILVFPFEPAVVTYAQTAAVRPSTLPPVVGSGPSVGGLAPGAWWLLATALAATAAGIGIGVAARLRRGRM